MLLQVTMMCGPTMSDQEQMSFTTTNMSNIQTTKFATAKSV